MKPLLSYHLDNCAVSNESTRFSAGLSKRDRRPCIAAVFATSHTFPLCATAAALLLSTTSHDTGDGLRNIQR